MAKVIKTRTAIQCRNHHQKYEAKYENTKNILKFYRSSVGKDNFKNYVATKKQKLKEGENNIKIEDS